MRIMLLPSEVQIDGEIAPRRTQLAQFTYDSMLQRAKVVGGVRTGTMRGRNGVCGCPWGVAAVLDRVPEDTDYEWTTPGRHLRALARLGISYGTFDRVIGEMVRTTHHGAFRIPLLDVFNALGITRGVK